MLVIHNRKHGIDFYKIWFAKEPFSRKGVVAYYEYMGDRPVKAKECHTLITDLTKPEEEIKKQFTKTCRNLINRAAKEEVSYDIRESRIENKELFDFCDFFAAFWESKDSSLENKEKLQKELMEYRDMNALVIGRAIIAGQTAVYHVYIKDEERVRLLYSASLYRLQGSQEGDNTKRVVIGAANRGLHFSEMQCFKDNGIMYYDWGGAGRGEDVIHITEFKESFGGQPVTYCNFEQVKGLKAKMFKLLLKVIGN